LFRRTRYQQGSLVLEERKKGPAVWVYRWWEKDINGKPVRRKLQIGSSVQYSTESAAQAAADALRLTINNPSNRRTLRQTTVTTLWEHYCREELPIKEMSTQDAYTLYAKNWILPRWGNLLLEEVKTVEVERWLRATDVTDGTKAKVKCVMSALFPTPSAGSSVATTQSRREFQSEPEERGAQALAFASVRSVNKHPCSCRQNK